MKQKYIMPDEVLLSSGDNELWIDLRNDHLLGLLQAEVKRTGILKLKEYLGHGMQSLVASEGKPFANECLFFVKPSIAE